MSNLQQIVNLWRVTGAHLFCRVYNKTGAPFFFGGGEGYIRASNMASNLPAASSQPLKITATKLLSERMYNETGVPSFLFGGGGYGGHTKFGCLLHI